MILDSEHEKRRNVRRKKKKALANKGWEQIILVKWIAKAREESLRATGFVYQLFFHLLHMYKWETYNDLDTVSI